MAEGRIDTDWGHTASMMAQLANLYRDKKSRKLDPDDIHPYGKRRKRKRRRDAPKVGIEALKVLLPKGSQHGDVQI